MRDEHGKILNALGLGLHDCHSVGRGSGLEADAEENHRLIRVVPGNFKSIQGGVDDAHISTGGLDTEQVSLRARHPQHIPIGGEDDLRASGEGNRLID